MAQTNKKTHKRVEYLYSRPSKIIIVVSYLSQCWWDTYTLLKSWKLSPPSNFFKYKVENSKEIKVVKLKNTFNGNCFDCDTLLSFWDIGYEPLTRGFLLEILIFYSSLGHNPWSWVRMLCHVQNSTMRTRFANTRISKLKLRVFTYTYIPLLPMCTYLFTNTAIRRVLELDRYNHTVCSIAWCPKLVLQNIDQILFCIIE